MTYPTSTQFTQFVNGLINRQNALNAARDTYADTPNLTNWTALNAAIEAMAAWCTGNGSGDPIGVDDVDEPEN